MEIISHSGRADPADAVQIPADADDFVDRAKESFFRPVRYQYALVPNNRASAAR